MSALCGEFALTVMMPTPTAAIPNTTYPIMAPIDCDDDESAEGMLLHVFSDADQTHPGIPFLAKYVFLAGVCHSHWCCMGISGIA